jgi:VanZ family protein
MLGLLILYLVVLVFLTLNPWLLPNPHSAVGFITWDMIDHATAYGGLSVLLMLVAIKKGPALSTTVMVVLACGLGGVFLEFCQYWFTSSRQLSLHDAVANVMGAALGATAFWSFRIVYDQVK